MLKKLTIKNIALIDECAINFDSGFNVLSGETGAGKSIIIDALNFVLGARADKSLIKNGEDFARVEGLFELSEHCDDIFNMLGQDKEDILILNRYYNLNGKNECRINGEIVTLSMLKKVGEQLVDVFGQNDHTFLLDTKKHINLLDALGEKEILPHKEKVKLALDEIKIINSAISDIGGEYGDRERNIDILKYQIDEIEKSDLRLNEEDELLQRKTLLLNSEKIVEGVSDINTMLNGGNICGNLKASVNTLNSLIKYVSSFEKCSERLNSARYEIEDVLSEVMAEISGIEYSERELNEIEERLDLIHTLKRKYGKDIAEVLLFLQNAKNKLDDLLNATEKLDELQKQKLSLLHNLYVACCGLTDARKLTAVYLSENMIKQLKELGIKNPNFKVEFKNNVTEDNIEKLATYNGCDDIEFMFSANLGEDAKSLNKIISGGEMSRFMLGFKCVVNEGVHKTYVFDEIDTGIGGQMGGVVAKKLAKIAKVSQVLCVTHLAQIASFSDVSFKIEKFESDNKTYSKINPLTDELKVDEITRMIGTGQNPNYAKLHAKELIKEAIVEKSKL